MIFDVIRRLFSKPSKAATPPERPVAAPEQPVTAPEQLAGSPETPAITPTRHIVDPSAAQPGEVMSATPPMKPTNSSRDESWRGPETQIGRMVKTIGQNCACLGMRPADFEVLADWCSMGHMPSMRRMMQHFESMITAEGKEHLQRYLAAGVDGQEEWDAFLTKNKNDCFNIRAYGFWLCRLADFGDEEAKAKIEAAPGMQYVAFMGGIRKRGPSMHAVSTEPITDPRFNNIFYYPGKIDSLRMGLLDVYKADGVILSWSESDKAYTGNKHAGDSGFDETGFGMEEEYDYFFYDEYFRLLRALYGWSYHDMRVNEERLRKEREEKRKEYMSEREAFMKIHGNEDAPVQ